MINRNRTMNPGIRLALLAALLTTAAAPLGARAELVVFTHGKVVKAVSHRDAGERIEIRFAGGGSLTLDRTLVERIERDEVAEADAKAPRDQPVAAQAGQRTPARLEDPGPAASALPVTSVEARDNTGDPRPLEESRPKPTARRSHKRHH